jgi:alpha-glutamyl/putrescinyl thymine pyrophosphorylase clade 1
MPTDLAPRLPLDPGPSNHKNRGIVVQIGNHQLRTTPVFDAYWEFAAERQRIFFRRLEGASGVLTTDPVLKLFKFTNAYRASDRVSQYLLRKVIYRDDLPRDARNVFFRTILFKFFNKIETWQHLESAIGKITWEDFDFARYDELLTGRRAAGETIYSAAYIMPSGGSVFGHKLKHQNHLRMIEHLFAERYPEKLSNCKTMREAFSLLRTVPFVGPFLAYQYVTDFNYGELTNFGEDEFVMAGPGALDGISKCFIGANAVKSSDVIRYMFDHQEEHFEKLDIEFPNLWGRRLQLIDCQNLFCEISKYARVAFPDYAGIAGRTRIKQKYEPTGPLPKPFYPPKWKIGIR